MTLAANWASIPAPEWVTPCGRYAVCHGLTKAKQPEFGPSQQFPCYHVWDVNRKQYLEMTFLWSAIQMAKEYAAAADRAVMQRPY